MCHLYKPHADELWYRNSNDVVEAHCYGVDIRQIKYIAESIATDCRTLRSCSPLSTASKTVLYAEDKGLRGRNVLQSVVDSATYLLKINLPNIEILLVYKILLKWGTCSLRVKSGQS